MPLRRLLELLLNPDLSRSLASAFPSLRHLRRAHALILTSGRARNPFVVARLLAFAAVSPAGSLPYADALFASLLSPTLFVYNSLIRGHALSPHPLRAARYYVRMLRAALSPDNFTLPFLLKSCSAPSSASLGRAVHCHAVKLGLDSDVFVANNAIGMYAGWRDMFAARRLFDECPTTDVVSWTAMVTGYSNCGEPDLARLFFDQMPERNPVSWNAMIAGYAQAGRKAEAWELLDGMPERNMASWSSMVSGFAQCGMCREALEAFHKMVESGVMPNEPALVSAVSACAQLRDVEEGEWLHRYIEEHKLDAGVILGTALVDMYGKCGSIVRALRAFKEMPVKNLYSWNSMITGLAMSGSGEQALTLYWKMRSTGLEPNDITFIGVLSACSHSGLVDEGQRFFDLMTRVHGIRPVREHYGCMVDLLGRAGLVKEALDFVEQMPFKPHPGLLGALAGACRIHGEVELGEEVGRQLIELEPNHGGRYVLLANIYAAARRWDDMAMVRKLLNERKAMKIPGNSKVEAAPQLLADASLSSNVWADFDTGNICRAVGYRRDNHIS